MLTVPFFTATFALLSFGTCFFLLSISWNLAPAYSSLALVQLSFQTVIMLADTHKFTVPFHPMCFQGLVGLAAVACFIKVTDMRISLNLKVGIELTAANV